MLPTALRCSMVKRQCSTTTTSLSAMWPDAIVTDEHGDVIGSDRYGDFDMRGLCVPSGIRQSFTNDILNIFDEIIRQFAFKVYMKCGR
jgi:hypothetical protein